MVAGLFIPTLGAYFWKKSSRIGAIVSMLSGGLTVVFLFFLTTSILCFGKSCLNQKISSCKLFKLPSFKKI